MTPTIIEAGIYDIPAAEYHADPCVEPSLSASIATILCTMSPAHARHAHPRLNPGHVEETAEHFDIGKAAHALLLEGNDGVAVIDAPDFRTKAAKEARDKAREAGLTPLLAGKWDAVKAMVAALRAQLDAHRDGGAGMFLLGNPERTVVWQEDDGTWCRARVDWLRTSPRFAIDDYKSTSASANPEDWTRSLFNCGADLQVAWYRRGVQRVLGLDDVPFRFCVQETYPPYALSVITLGPDALLLAEKKVLYALELWRRCMDANVWPTYPHLTCYAGLPPWEEARWLEREMR